MRIVEKVLAVTFVIGLVLKFTTRMAGDQIVFLSLFLLALLYYVFGFMLLNDIRLKDVIKKEAYKNVSGMNIIVAIVCGMTLATLCMGALFKLVGYEGADQLLFLGLAATVLVLPFAIRNFFVTRDKKSRIMMTRILITSAAGLFLFFLPQQYH